MNRIDSTTDLSLATCARRGSRVGLCAALVYAALFTLYAVIRTTWEIASIGEVDAGVFRTIGGTGLSLMIAAASVTLVMLVPSALLGLLTGVGTWGIQRIPGVRSIPYSGGGAGILAAGVLYGAIALAGADLMGGRMLEDSPATWWFWFGLPGLVWLATAAAIGRDLVTPRDAHGADKSLERNHGHNAAPARASQVEQSR